MDDSLRAYASGDMEGAIRAWILGLRDGSLPPVYQDYLDFVREHRSDIVERALEPSPEPSRLGQVEHLETEGAAPGMDAVINNLERHQDVAGDGEISELEDELRMQLELDDLSHAVATAKRILAVEPEHSAAQDALTSSSSKLEKMYCAQIGELDRVPKVLSPPEDVVWLDLDHRAGFVLAQIDGQSKYEEVIEVAGLDRVETLAILAKLVEQGVIG